MADDLILSRQARERMASRLPSLLHVVRRRRHRRQWRRAAVAVALAGLLVVPFTLPDQHPAVAPNAFVSRSLDPEQSRAVVSVCRVVGNVPGVLDRYRVQATVQPQWFIDDDELQRLLQQDGRPAGLVRIAGRVLVAREALDPLTPTELE